MKSALRQWYFCFDFLFLVLVFGFGVSVSWLKRIGFFESKVGSLRYGSTIYFMKRAFELYNLLCFCVV